MMNLRELLFLHAASGGGSPVEMTATGNPVSFTTKLAKPLKSITVPLTYTQAGSGDPSPSNIRPISGVSSLSAYRTGVNIFDEVFEEGTLNASTGQDKPSSENIRSKNYISVVPGKKFYFKYNAVASGTNLRLFYYGADKSYIDNKWVGGAHSYTMPSDAYYVRFYADTSYSASGDRKISINYPYTETDYVPYNGTEVDVTFPADVGTVYGGSLDLVSGVLTITDSFIEAYNGETLPSTWVSDRDVYSQGTEPTTGAQVVYKLSEPSVVQLDPHSITAIKGTNTIWTDTTGDLTIKYYDKA